jgi:hypothetical protein
MFTWFRNLLWRFLQSLASRSKSRLGEGGTGPKRCYEILLPLTHNDGREVDLRLYLQTHDDLLNRFGAVSFIPQLVRGTWVHEGQRFHNDSRRIFVDVEETPETRAFFLEYKRVLEERFDQVVIYIRSYPVEIL